MPFHHARETGKLVSLKFLDGAEHPVLSMVVDEDDFAESIIQTGHNGGECINNGGLGYHDGTRHTNMVVGVPAVVERRNARLTSRPSFAVFLLTACR